MAIRILLPAALRPYAGHRAEISVEALSVGEALEKLSSEFPSLRRYIFEEDGRLRNFVNVFVNGQSAKLLKGERTELRDGDTLMLIPSIAGGSQGAELLAALGAGGFTKEELVRYSRHLLIPEVGLEGQRKLKEARVLVVGMGGLGNPAAMFLAAAGVGTIGVVDYDRVEKSNLQRQVLFGEADVGRSKAEVAAQRLKAINPHVEVKVHELKLSSSNALDVIRDYDVVIDATDNFPTRYLLNDACALLGKPDVYASIFRFEGQASVFDARRGPCYRCLYPTPPPAGLVPSCAEGGVLGVLPGIMGSVQALEAIKLILGKGEPLIGRLLYFDAIKLQFHEFRVSKDPSCPLCGPSPSIRELIDYEDFCRVHEQVLLERGNEVTPQELKRWLEEGRDVLLLDVREPFEHELVALPNAKLVPLRELAARAHELDTARTIVVYCHMGERSMLALQILRSLGFRRVKHLQGGIDAWAEQVDPSMLRY
jgi:molybdopterin/thiamine biosynthesis adenylyltransferase/rhodanese-related sulfurtransferase/molybdopterin converting factor small subunit